MRTLGKIVVTSTVTALAALSFAACGSNDASSGSASSSVDAAETAPAVATTASKGRECTADDVKTTGSFGQAPTIAIPDNCDPPSTLIVKDLVPGTGPTVTDGVQLTANYTLVTWSNKKQADSSFGAQPFQFSLSDVIPGWSQGLQGMKQGGRRLLIIPPSLGYGPQGNSSIGPNETLVFVTDAVNVPAN